MPEAVQDEMTPDALARLRPIPLAKKARIVTGLSQQAFCDRYGIPIGSQRDWEQERVEPPQATASYLTAILFDPEAVANALAKAVVSPAA